jgi:L-ascorbate metabolism protein UlaG (beta-lactamase superfamily)
MNESGPTAGPPRIEVTWIGHSTVLIDVGGYRILTDPLLTRRVAHLRRRRPLPDLDQIDPVDLVLLSHVHMDHLHRPSLRRLASGPAVVCPRGADGLLDGLKFASTSTVEPGDQLDFGPITLSVTRAEHKGTRGPHSRVAVMPVGYVIESAGRRIYFPGDTDLFDEMTAIAPVDLALLPIWGWGPTIGTGHLDPRRAVEAAERLQANQFLPIHWGTYAPEDARRAAPEWLDKPIADLSEEVARSKPESELCIVEPGGSLDIS